ncbi:cell wall metabolism sensor histidine kinase WalK [Clostridium sp. SHJSY1]|uniref:HAMP domain-containing sensor histidine kinase n=1 Tax=Clostridium sp. SHJSY1 TaxID=2942483 RepID=UPI002875053A|nr:ATP-binding protein [Clostridium sp. SHJSY1]MDS0526916.1 cell wall metabolism sensor histidine kinase WalK [Clostridium sp. SHJSY1]
MIKRNITFKLTVGFLSIVIISTLILGLISLNTFKNNIYEIKKNNMKKHALAISQTLEPYVDEAANRDEFVKIINLLGVIDNSKIWIINTDKEIITAGENQNRNVNFIDDTNVKEDYSSAIDKALNGEVEELEQYNSYYQEEMITILTPIKNNNRISGVVMLNSSISDLSNSMNKFFVHLIEILFGEIIIIGIIGYYFSKGISKPIMKINNAALELARGQYGIKTNIYQKDEIGELSSSFDLLSLKLKYTIEKLSEEKNKLNNIIKSMSDGILALDLEFNLININKSAKNILSIRSENEVLKILSNIEIKSQFEIISERKSVIKKYEDKTLELTISPIKSSSNDILGWVILIQDITEKEKLEQMRKDFVSNVSHEFRTPLTIIKGNLELILDGIINPEDIMEVCSTIIKETNRLERMVKDLLNLSKLESGNIDTEITKIDVNMLINDTLRSLRVLIREKNIDLQLLLSNELLNLMSDYNKLKQLLIIFLDNAIKFSKVEGRLDVITYKDKKNIYIEIKDYGVGIPKEDIKYLGDRFFKSDKSRRANVEGTGLGLSIAKKLVKVLNGELNIESELGEGTKIIVSLPIINDGEEV